MKPRSAGILLWRRGAAGTEVLLAHFGGPLWARKDAGAWSIPKGLVEPGETAEEAARREYREELGLDPPEALVAMREVRQPGGKRVQAFAAEGDLDPAAVKPGTFAMEWPPGSGRTRHFPEVDRVGWFGLEDAAAKILPGQRPLLDELPALLGAPSE